MKSSAIRLAFAIGLVLARRAWAEDTFYAMLEGANEVPGPGMVGGSVPAVIVVDGTKVSLSIALKGLTGWMAPHLHKGAAGVAGRLVVQTGKSFRMSVAFLPEKWARSSAESCR